MDVFCKIRNACMNLANLVSLRCWDSCYQWISLQICLFFSPNSTGWFRFNHLKAGDFSMRFLNLCIPIYWYLSLTSLKKYDLFNICGFQKEWWLGNSFFSAHPSKTTSSNWIIPKLSGAKRNLDRSNGRKCFQSAQPDSPFLLGKTVPIPVEKMHWWNMVKKTEFF